MNSGKKKKLKKPKQSASPLPESFNMHLSQRDGERRRSGGGGGGEERGGGRVRVASDQGCS